MKKAASPAATQNTTIFALAKRYRFVRRSLNMAIAPLAYWSAYPCFDNRRRSIGISCLSWRGTGDEGIPILSRYDAYRVPLGFVAVPAKPLILNGLQRLWRALYMTLEAPASLIVAPLFQI